jgi:hypothetical protein
MSERPIDDPAPRLRRRSRLLAGALALVLLALHLAAIGTEGAHRDEFTLLYLARLSAQGSALETGGRPGLGVLAVLPLVGGCSDEMATLRHARWLWTVFTVLLVAGFYALLRQALPAGVAAEHAALLGTGLLVLVPVFVRWSLQVRTDQPALAAALWGGAALLASRRRPSLALAAGALFGLGFLASQKAIYAVALAGLLAVAGPLVGRTLRLRREALRALLAAGAAVAVVGGYLAILARFGVSPKLAGLRGGLTTFAFYRSLIGYGAILERPIYLLPHLVLGALLVGVTAVALRRRIARRGEVAAAWAVLLLGAAVYLFHDARFPYFWMTLGLFLATALAFVSVAVPDLLGPRRARRLLAACWAVLAVQSLATAAAMLEDTQAVQRRTLADVARNFRRDARGFQAEGALFCRADPRPFPIMMGFHLRRDFTGPEADGRIAAFLAGLRADPPAYVIDSHRLAQFPPAIREFWNDHYRLYRDRLRIPAVEISGVADEPVAFEILVAGAYRWRGRRAPPGRGHGELRIDGRPLAPGGVVGLAAGAHVAEWTGGGGAGTLWLAVTDPPGPATEPFFHLL